MALQGRQVVHEIVGHALVSHVVFAHRVVHLSERGRRACLVRDQRRNPSKPPRIIPQAMIKNARFWLGCHAPASLLLLKFSMMRTCHDATPTLRGGLFNLAQFANMRPRSAIWV